MKNIIKNRSHIWLIMFVVWLFAMDIDSRATGTLDGPPVQITDAGLPAGEDSSNVQIAVQGDSLYAVWSDQRTEFGDPFDGQIYFSKSDDRGSTWSANTLITVPGVEDWVNSPDVTVTSSGIIMIVYHLFRDQAGQERNDIKLTLSRDGETFPPESVTFIDGDNNDYDHRMPLLVTDESDGYTYLLNRDYRYFDSADEGYNFQLTSFDPELGVPIVQNQINDVVRAGRGSDDELPDYAVAARNGKFCAAWDDKRERLSIYGACSTDNGVTFGASFRISESDRHNPDIEIAPDGSLVTTYFRSDTIDEVLVFRRSEDNGLSWGDEIEIVRDRLDVLITDLSVNNDGQILIASSQDPFAGEGNVFLYSSLNNGATWSSLTVAEYDDLIPGGNNPRQVAIVTEGSGDDARAHIAWHDDRADLLEFRLYTQRVILDGATPTQIGMVSEHVVTSILFPIVLFTTVLLFATGQIVRKW